MGTGLPKYRNKSERIRPRMPLLVVNILDIMEASLRSDPRWKGRRSVGNFLFGMKGRDYMRFRSHVVMALKKRWAIFWTRVPACGESEHDAELR
jgi:hypothetical protein